MGRHRLLKTSVLQVRLLSGVLAEMEQQWLGRFIPFTSVSAILTSVTKCWCGSTVEQLSCKQSVAGSTPVTSPRMRSWCSGKHPWLPTRRHEFESRRAAPQIPARGRSHSLVTQLGECLSYKEEVAGSNPAEATKPSSVAQSNRAPIF